MRPASFSVEMDATVAALTALPTELNAYGDAVEVAEASATAAAATAVGAAQSLTDVADASVWVSGTTYTAGDCRWSPTDFFTYRRKTNGAGTTDPALDTANWTRLNPSQGVGSSVGTSSAVDVTLTNSGVRVHNINMSTTGKSVFMPDATTITDLGVMWIIRCAGNAMTVRNGAGILLARLTTGQAATFFVTDITNASGTWVCRILPDFPALFSPGTAAVGNAVASVFTKLTQLSATQALCTYSAASNYIWAIVISVVNGSITYGTAVQVNSVNNSSDHDLVALSSNKAMVVAKTASGYLSGVILDVNTGTLAITVNTIYTLSGTTPVTDISAAMLTSTKVICCYRDNNAPNYPYAVILDVTGGTTIANGTAAIIASAAMTSGNKTDVVALSSTKAMCSYTITTSMTLYACILDVSGSTITPATPYSVTTNGYYGKLAMLTSTRALCLYDPSGGQNYSGIILDVSTSTISAAGSAATALTGAGAAVNSVDVVSFTTAKALLVYAPTSTFLNCKVLDIGATTVTGNTAQVLNGTATTYIKAALMTTFGSTVPLFLIADRNSSTYLESVAVETGVAI